MPGSRNTVRHGTASRELIEQLARERPELLPWLRPLQVALHAAAQEAWRSLAPVASAMRNGSIPVLHGAVVPVDPVVVRAHVHAVLGATFEPAVHERIDSIDPVALLESAVAQDEDRLHMMAERSGLDSARLAAAAQLAALPLLHACAHALAPATPDDWRERYCHVCGALPLLVEVLGLDRARQLRCGRCGCAWATHVLLCPFCGEHDHAQLGSLVPEGALGQVCWVETCTTCGGYWKARSVLRAAPAHMLLLDDARSLELDVIAAERGYARPTHGFRTRVRVAPAAVANVNE
jgi:FdhE protein